MRLRDVQVLLGMVSSELKADVYGAGSGQAVRNRTQLQSNITLLTAIPSLKRLATEALSHTLFSSKSSTVSITDFDDLRAKLEELSVACYHIDSFLATVLPAAPEYYLGVKLPPDVTSLAGMQGAIGSLCKIFDEPLRVFGYVPVQVTSVEPGSVWVELAVGSVAAMSVVAAVLKVAQAYLELKRSLVGTKGPTQAPETESSGTQPTVVATERREEMILEFTSSTLKANSSVLSSAGGSLNAEHIHGVMRVAVEQASVLYTNGSEFSPQLNASAELQKRFPEVLSLTNARQEVTCSEIRRLLADVRTGTFPYGKPR